MGSGYEGKIQIGMDIAAAEFFKNGKYDLDFKNPESKEADWISSDELGEMYKGFIKDYPVVSIEDPFDQDDWEGYTKLTSETDIQIVGDDLLVTNPKRIQTAIDKKHAMRSFSRSIKLGPSPSLSVPTKWPRHRVGEQWFPTGLEKLRIVSSLT